MKKILLLGGSAQQVIAIKTAKKLGLNTVLCDYLPDNPGQFITDKFYQISTTDVEAVYEVAKKEKVDGILAYASDPAALPAAIVSERLGLPTNPAESVKILGLKHHWRDFLKNNNFAYPQHYRFISDSQVEYLVNETKEFSFPMVIKPTDSSGSKGVTIINKYEELGSAINSAKVYSRNDILIIEEYIERGFPSVIGGDIFVWKGKVVFYGLMECLRDVVNSPLIPIGEKYPILLTPKQDTIIKEELQRIITTLEIKSGELNVEILLDKNNNVHLLELGPRAGGNMIPIQLSDAYGIDFVKANIQVAIGEEPDFIQKPIIPNNGCYMHYVLHSYKSGYFKGIEIDESIKKFLYKEVLYKKEGDIVEYFDGAGKALGIIFLHFNNINEMELFCSNHNALIKIILSPF